MIMARNEDGTYSQVGFVKDNVGIDTEYIYDKDGDIVFEKGFTRETSGTVPLTINGIGKDLKDWSITGNTVQNGTPTPENPVEVQAVGDRTGNIVAAEANHINPMFGLSVVWEKGGSEMIINGKATGGESARFATIELDAGTYTLSITGLDETGWNKTGFYLSGVDTARVQGERTYTITEPTSARLQFVVNASDVSYENRKVTIMFTKTSTALPYEPYGYKIPVVTSADGTEPITTPIYLGEVQTTRKIKKAVLNGTETTWISSTIQGRMSFYWKTGTQNPTGAFVLCTHYKSEYAVREGVCFITTNNVAIIDSNFQSLDDFKTYLADEYAAGHPVTVWYVQNIPTTGIVNEPLMKIGGYADTLSMEQAGVQIPTLNGTTVIDVDTAVKPTEIYTKYKSSK